MSVVINVQSINNEDEDRKVSFGDKCCQCCMSHPQLLLWFFILLILGITIGISEYAKQNKI